MRQYGREEKRAAHLLLLWQQVIDEAQRLISEQEQKSSSCAKIISSESLFHEFPLSFILEGNIFLFCMGHLSKILKRLLVEDYGDKTD